MQSVTPQKLTAQRAAVTSEQIIRITKLTLLLYSESLIALIPSYMVVLCVKVITNE